MSTVAARLEPGRVLALTARLSWAIPVCVWGSWAAMLSGLLICVNRYSRSYPLSDELYYATSSITPSWLWEQHAEHRIPLAKLIWLGVLKLTNFDFRVGNWLSVFLVAAMTGAVVYVATSLRGRMTLSDALLPLAILNLGQALNVVWWWQVNHVLAPLIATGLLLVVVRTAPLTFQYALIAGACLLLLPFAGPDGLPYALGLGLWLGYGGILFCRSTTDPNGQRKGILLLSIVAIAFVSVGLYFVNYSVDVATAAGLPVTQPGWRESLRASLEVLSLSLGPSVRPYWRLAAAALLGLLLVSVTLLAMVSYRRPEERLRAGGLLLFIGALGSVLFVLGRARVGLGDDYLFAGHYLNLAVLALCAIYFTYLLYAPVAIRNLVHFGLLAAACVLFLGNMNTAIAIGRSLRYGQEALTYDIQAGMPPSILAERHLAFLNPAATSATDMGLVQLLDRMRRERLPQFTNMAYEPVYREVPLDASRLDRSIDLGQRLFVYAVRIQSAYADTQTFHRISFRMTWSETDPLHPEFASTERMDDVVIDVNPFDMWAVRYDRVGKQTLTMWVNGVIDGFRIDPWCNVWDWSSGYAASPLAPCSSDRQVAGFTISAISLVVPAGS